MQPSLQTPSSRAPLKKDLSGRTFLLTRTHKGNIAERRMLESFGAKVVELPSISISKPKSWKRADSAILRLEQFDWVLFTSANGVKFFFGRVKKKDSKLFQRLRKNEANPKFACVGPSTRRELEGLGFRCSLQPKEYKAVSLGKELARRMSVDGKKILFAKAEVGNKQLSKILRGSGAKVSEAPVYRTLTLSKKLQPKFLERITDITLTSPSTVEGLLGSASPAKIRSRKVLIHCIGPVTAKHAKARGLDVENVAKTHTVEGLVEAIVKL